MIYRCFESISKTSQYVKFSTFKKGRPFDFKSKKNETFTKKAQAMMDDVFTQFREKVENDTILKDFRKDIFSKQRVEAGNRAFDKQYDDQQRKIDKILDDKDPIKSARFSKKLMSTFANNRNAMNNKSLFREYADYTAYESNKTKLDDRNLGDNQFFDYQQATQKTYKLYDSLSEDYQDKIELQNSIRNVNYHERKNMTISEIGEILQHNINMGYQMTKQRINHYRTQMNPNQNTTISLAQANHPYADYEETIDHNFQFDGYKPMSNKTINKIYELYLQGWTIRDISKRFGILPQRAKFIVWSRAQLYTQVLPKLGMKQFILDMMEQQQLANESGGYLDYGVDLDYFSEKNIISNITEWNQTKLNAQRNPKQHQISLQKLAKLKEFKKYQKVQIKTEGKWQRIYSFKQWHIFKGKGSNDYFLENRTFRALSKARRKMLYKYY